MDPSREGSDDGMTWTTDGQVAEPDDGGVDRSDEYPGGGMRQVRWVTIGRIMGAFGVRGDVRVKPLTEDPRRILGFPSWWLWSSGKAPRLIRVLTGRPHGEDVVVRLQGVTDREQAQSLSGETLRVKRDEFPEAEEGAYYWFDLVGCRVRDGDGNTLGVVEEMMATGANDVLVIRAPDGDERLLPFIRDVVPHVNLDERTITVNLLPGL